MKSVLFFFFLIFSFLLNAQPIAPHITLDLYIIDEAERPIEGAIVLAGFAGWQNAEDQVVKARSDTNGWAIISGRSLFAIPLTVDKKGYYQSTLEVFTSTWSQKDNKNIYSNQTVTIVLRKITNPIPMFAYKNLELLIPALNSTLGLDLEVADWVYPHGKGTTADLFFEMNGFWNNINHHDSALTLSFPNNGDGIIGFSLNEQSHFKSPRTAPLTGYTDKHSWRISRLPDPEHPDDIIAIDETSNRTGYVIRTRTKLDEQGRVESANYGKLYGDPKFNGATLGDPYGYILISYFMNPTTNDQNLEYDPKSNLLMNLLDWKQPKEP